MTPRQYPADRWYLKGRWAYIWRMAGIWMLVNSLLWLAHAGMVHSGLDSARWEWIFPGTPPFTVSRFLQFEIRTAVVGVPWAAIMYWVSARRYKSAVSEG